MSSERRRMLFPHSSDPWPRQETVREQGQQGLTAYERLEIACRQIVGILQTMAKEVGRSPLDRASYDAYCASVDEWLGEEINNLRFLHG